MRLLTAVPAALFAALLGSSVIAPSTARAGELPDVDVGFYVQPQLKARQNSIVANDENGFAVRRTRVLLSAERPLGCLTLSFAAELELFPDFTAQDGAITLAGPLTFGRWSASLGQFKAPFSRSALVSDSRLQLVEKPQIAGLAPERQVGAAGTLELPMSEISIGVFNGEGKNIVDNADEKFMYVGRVAFRPLGAGARLAEAGLGETQVWIAASLAHNVRDRGDYDETRVYYGVDGFASWNGVSLGVEWLQTDTSFSAGAPDEPFLQNGFYVQAGYLLPLPGWAWRRFEVAGRLEEVDRNDQLPIQQPGNEEQSQRHYSLGASYYHDAHDLKVQLQASHIDEIEDRTFMGADAVYDNDTVLVQITYRQ